MKANLSFRNLVSDSGDRQSLVKFIFRTAGLINSG